MIYPSRFPTKNNAASLESEFYDRFRLETPKHWKIYYSLTLITPDVPMREIDFVVITEMGVVTVELKNGKWREKKGIWEFYNVRRREWERVEGKAYKSPLEQAETQKEYLKEFFRNHNHLQDLYPDECYHSAIFFLKNERSEFRNHDRGSMHIFGKSELSAKNSLTKLVNSCFVSKEYQNTKLVETAHQIIVKNLNFFQNFKTLQQDQDEILYSYTKEQFYLVSQMQGSRLNLIFGSAGVGKSILAGELALREARSGKKVMLWQGSLGLFALWKQELELLPEKAFIQIVATPSEITDFTFDVFIADGWETVLEGASESTPFPWFSESFWSEKKCILFMGRAWKHKEHSWIQFLKGFPFVTLDLKRNIRNSSEIVEFANLLFGDTYETPSLGNWTDIQLIALDDDPKDQLRWCIGYAKRMLGIESDEIVLLLAKQDLISEYKLDPLLEELSLRSETVESFRGLEETCGIFLGFRAWEKESTRFLLAETLLQIRTLACIFYPPEEEETMQNLWKR